MDVKGSWATGVVSGSIHQGFAVIVPGLGDFKRAETVRRNIEWLKEQNVSYDCTIYVYRPEREFPLESSDYAPCKLVRHRGLWMDHIKEYPLKTTNKKWVVLMLDGVQPENVSLAKIGDIMNVNRLGRLAPSIPDHSPYSS